ncbi:hypothetical protein ACWT_5725 [Actinoplanes sp. SE50]|uniref:DUF6301 family protein n=1 Tax=unclassified Actinoplanes TaxID=2626549 RepID=UPI00023ED4B9|nr:MULTISPECIES: DUF6301 family protein [unclassified Actinoplanes]AEV86743.1 hypothetical protein ACPL_5856 [Actinoplanes sp. SE50/110]ATO85140.1 hypothetical protein ACWT_5725 [Actinoplanes sp. SE50]SLM02551.1 hypothetical protein ACSP50_5801 [Actinoplanes sp. SE50/110]
MADWQALDEAGILQTAQRLLSAEPWLMTTSLTDMAARFGWTVSNFNPDYPTLGAFIDDGRGLGPESGFVRLDEQSRVQHILLSLTESVAEEGPDVDAFLQDVFADATAALTGEFGRPTPTVYGEEPQLWWQRPATMFGLLTEIDAVSLQLSPNELMGGEWE